MDPSYPILLCDTSYIVFYKYYAIKSWFKRAQDEEVDIDNIMNNVDFIKKYDQSFEKMIEEFSKRYNVPFKNIVFAKDCMREKIWRTKIYPAYKACRDDKTSSFNREIFKHTYDKLLPRLKSTYGFTDIGHTSLEADDIIALFVAYLKKINDTCAITIITNDNDYVQLYKHGVGIYNIQHKSLRDRIDDVDNYLALKIIIGDKSDNIKAIGKKIGEKTAQKMLQDPAFNNKVMSMEGVREQYILNKTLIDFDSIPMEFQEDMKQVFWVMCKST